ncbi:MAG: Rhs family protein [Brevibacillus sp.]|nr:Rhs family protein [Brevibacillus sp.]
MNGMRQHDGQSLDSPGHEAIGSGLPGIALPKGGGAIQGIGEKYSVNAMTGTFSLTVPIAVTQGRGGFSPEVGLSYDSGSGNGPFGIGWNVSVPSIVRKTEKGLPQYRDSEESDTFIYSGVEDLVPFCGEDGSPIVPAEVGNYRVKRYRSRTEGAFIRIESWEHRETGERHWRSISGDNVTRIFGRSTECRIADPTNPKHIFRWLLEETSDDKGNVTIFEYKAENSDGVDQSEPQERNRSLYANRYLKRIVYGNSVPNNRGGWRFYLVFDYGEHDHYKPTLDETQKWFTRQDPFSNYRSGFEIRTNRLCRRALMFHHFNELGPEPVLVRSTDFGYMERPDHTFLSTVTQNGYLFDKESEKYSVKPMPPLQFEYTEALFNETIQTLSEKDAENLPIGLDGNRYRWVDLDGEGLNGLFTDQANAWFYKRNLGGGRFGPLERISTKPSSSRLNEGRQQLMDLAGDGRLAVVQFKGPMAGYQMRTIDGEWEPFVPFPALPNIDWDGPDVRFIDVTGDGSADLLITSEAAFTYYPSMAVNGFDEAVRVNGWDDEEKGPKLLFGEAKQSIFLADMCGDGLTDIVRIRNGEICYWPNLGYGRFGSKVTMSNAPEFDHPDKFDAKKVRLIDLDGSGPTDLLYIGGDQITMWFNQSGNRWSNPRHLRGLPTATEQMHVTVVDLLGQGTACLVWSSALPVHSREPLRYIDLFSGQKPHLLCSFHNNLGAQTTIRYAASTKFYLRDLEDGNPWVTKLPFPVHVAVQTETCDQIENNRFSSRYAYHHGYYDRTEKEFRGFGMVEQWDTEELSALTIHPASNLEPSVYVHPVLTKSWYHTGAYYEDDELVNHYAANYFRDPHTADQARILLKGMEMPLYSSPQQECEAFRALKGSLLRQEVYALDNSNVSEIPYTITEKSYSIRLVQPIGPNRHAVFQVLPRETVEAHYERQVIDPRISHTFVLETDPFGNVCKSASIGYGRRQSDSSLSIQEQQLQSKTHVTYTEQQFTNAIDVPNSYRTPQLCDTTTYEISGMDKPQERLYPFESIQEHVKKAAVIPFEAEPGEGLQKRIVNRSRVLFLKDDLSAALPLGVLEPLALPYESYQMVLTYGMYRQWFENKVDFSAIQAECGYVQMEDAWWAPSGRIEFNPERFYQPVKFTDLFGGVSHAHYDEHNLVIVRSVDAAGNVTSAVNNYRVMQPEIITDPNNNRSAAVFDELGIVTATAIMGKEGGKEQGDTLDDPTVRIQYDLFEWMINGRPAYVHSMQREHHGLANSRWLHSYLYTDGFYREIMRKTQAEPGLAHLLDVSETTVRDADGKTILVNTGSEPRWAATGRTVYNNKGHAVKKYEPFYSASHRYESESEMLNIGITPLMTYDPIGRLIRTDHPNGTFTRIKFHPWYRDIWDENDTVLESGWYALRTGGSPEGTEPDIAERRAAQLTSKHAETVSREHFDSLGRTVIASVKSENGVWHVNRHELDITGSVISVTDSRGLRTAVQRYDMLKRRLYMWSMDAGERWTLLNAAGKPVQEWNSRGVRLRRRYDSLLRLTHLYAVDLPEYDADAIGSDEKGAQTERLLERILYGESLPHPEEANMRGHISRHYDEAGVLTHEEYDMKGNTIKFRRQLLADYKSVADWSILAEETDFSEIDRLAQPVLETEAYTTNSAYDAVNRIVRMTAPDSDKSETIYAYNVSGLLEQIDVRIRDATDWTKVVANIDYDAKGQRTRIEYGNGVHTSYEYDPFTYRLKRLSTFREKDNSRLQDIRYTYDPVGNIIGLEDLAQQTVYFDNSVVSPAAYYEFDALYRIVRAEGREHAGQLADRQRDHQSIPRMNIPHPNDAQSMRRYVEQYTYDSVGNLLAMRHNAEGGTWSRSYDIAWNSNRLLATSSPDEAEKGLYGDMYGYNAHGSMTSMPHLTAINWNSSDRMTMVSLGGGGKSYYVYDAEGKRIRAIVERTDGLVEERIYLGHFEIFRRRVNGEVKMERQTLHVMDGKKRVAIIETKTIDTKESALMPSPIFRYQLADLANSSRIEADAAGLIISYEEYHPFGTTAYHAAEGSVEVSLKRYRHAGKECDEETGFYHYEARYYAPWLGRWISYDPGGLIDGLNIYAYVRNNPVTLTDPTGMYSEAGHYYTVYFVSLAVGFSPEVAYRNAFYAQMPDEVNEFDAIEVEWERQTSFATKSGAALDSAVNAIEKTGASFANGMMNYMGYYTDKPRDPAPSSRQTASAELQTQRDDMQRGLHTLTGGSTTFERSYRDSVARKLEPGSLEFGLNLHAFGDSYSHATIDNENVFYETGLGHGVELGKRLSGTAPDQIPRRKELYYQYVGHLYDVLSDIAKKQGLKPRLSKEQVLAAATDISFRQAKANQIDTIRGLAKALMGVDMKPYQPEREGAKDLIEFAGNHSEDIQGVADILRRVQKFAHQGHLEGSTGH